MNESVSQGEVSVPVGPVAIAGHFVVPQGARGVVLFSHGSGSSRHSPRNNYVAKVLQEAELATFLFDLLTPEEDAVYQNRFNIDLLTERLVALTHWLKGQPSTGHLPIGYFGASTGAASALRAAARLGERVKAVVSRGGRPDLAIAKVAQVTAPVLLLVGSLDEPVIRFNQEAFARIESPKELNIVPGASHLFEEPGKLGEVARLAADWFGRYL